MSPESRQESPSCYDPLPRLLGGDGKPRGPHPVKRFRVLPFKVCLREAKFAFLLHSPPQTKKAKAIPPASCFTPMLTIYHPKGEKKNRGLYELYVETYTQIWSFGSLLDPIIFSTPAGFFLRTVFQVAACVYSTGLLENLGKGKIKKVQLHTWKTICSIKPHMCCA